MDSLIVAGILVVIVGAAILYIRKERKKGAKCIGCPACGHCSGGACGSAAHGGLKKRNRKNPA